MTRTRKVVIAVEVMLGLFLLIALDWMFGGLRFDSPSVNIVVGQVALCLPALSGVLLAFVPRSRARVWGLACLVPVAVLCLVADFVDVVFSTPPAKVTQQAGVPWEASRISTYYDYGFAGDVYVTVLQEIVLLPGLLWVHPIVADENMDDIKIKPLNRHHVECDYILDDSATPEKKRLVAWVL